MRNLELLYSVQLSPLKDLEHIQCSAVDYDTGVIYCASSKCIVGLNPKDGQITGVVSLLTDDYMPTDGSGKVVGIQCIPDQQSVCVAIDNGNLLVWNVLVGDLECVGNVESGFTSMCWSPDLELLVLTTGQDTLIMMTREFDPVTEKSLHPEQFGSAEFVTVGWGKKETQFHGSVGKQAATIKPEDEKPALPWDDRKPRISWRGDGQFFVVSTISPISGARKLRVWSRECEHDSTSENIDGVEHALCWKPSGSLVASSMRKPNRHEIIFFEKNGLRHGEFTLPFGVKEVEVKEVLWNIDSTVLAVWCEDMATEDKISSKSYVQLWTVGNYHWYLKQSLYFNSDKPTSVIWDPEHAYKLHIVSSAGKYSQFTWSWATNCSCGKTENDQALVAVIDGDQVLLSPMRNMVVPPSMSAYSLQLPCAVNQVIFCCHGNTNDLAVLLENSQIAMYTFNESQTVDDTVKFDGAGGGSFAVCCKTPVLKGIYRIEGLPEGFNQNPLSVSHVTWLNEDNIILVLVDQSIGDHSIICNGNIQKEDAIIKISSTSDLEDHVFKLAVSNDSGHVGIQLPDGSLLKYDPVNESIMPWEDNSGQEINFPLPCTQMAVCDIGGQEVVLGLTDRYRFYVNNVEVATNCTSFAIHDEFLLLTTLSHTCRCICRKTKVEVLPTLSDGKEHPFDESIRRVERGSRIVHVVSEDTKLILQMPRGNLETIHPRALVLSAVRKALDRMNFKAAMILMKKHRINLNLMFDHNPTVFLENVKEFVQQVESVNNINLFISDLYAEDVTVTMYTAAYQKTADDKEFPNKVNTVCDAVRQALIDNNENKYLLSILVTYVRKTTPELEKALLLVRALREKPLDQVVVSAEEALKYLLFLVDVNEMYDVALGTYDFDLVLMVAEKSQKDPKEYIPFLNLLRQLEGHYKHFTIDRYLKRYKKALNHITKCGAEHFNECVSLVKEHNLFTEALQLYSPGSQQYKHIATLYGEYLSEKSKDEEAGIMFVKAECWEQALSSFQDCKNWRQVFCMTARLKYSQDKEVDIAKKLSGQLKELRRHQEAAVILEQYVMDVEESIVCLIEGCLWEEALRMMYKHSRTDFIESNLKTALVETCEHQMDTLNNLHNDFDKYTNRLDAVRKQKEKERLEFLESGGDLCADADLYSDTSSATGESVQSSRYSTDSRQSTYSKSSGKSSKNRRKAEHKKWKLKEGSQYEDLALIAALSTIIKTVDNLRDEIQSLLKALVQFHFDKQAVDLQKKYSDCLSDIEKAIPDIWSDEATENRNEPVLGPMTTANSIAQAVQRGQVVSEKQDPIIRIAPTLNKDKKWKLVTLDIGKS
ncbi:elongator complex protein 1-like [Mytilus edulis]|uniref:elongator complex protein 1-like n=1 Tax=Mytilus edulis TaxID=6550 RepID=UPI0039EE27B7